MHILFAISILCFFASLLTAIALARHLRQTDGHQLIRKPDFARISSQPLKIRTLVYLRTTRNRP